MGSGKPLGLWKAIKEALRTIRTPKKPCIWAVEAINKALRTITWRKETLHMGSGKPIRKHCAPSELQKNLAYEQWKPFKKHCAPSLRERKHCTWAVERH